MPTAAALPLPPRLVAAGLLALAVVLVAGGAARLVDEVPLPYRAEPLLAACAAAGLLLRQRHLVWGYVAWHLLAYLLVLVAPASVTHEPIGLLALIALGLPAVAVAMVVVGAWDIYGVPVPPPATARTQPLWFTPGTAKLVLMSLATLGLYDLYWHYRNWRLVRERERSGILPLWRAVFGVLWAWSLFGRIRDSAAADGSRPLPAGLLAAGYVLAHLLYQLPDPWWPLALASVAPLAVANSAGRRAALARGAFEPNASLSPWNWLAVGTGGLLLAASVIDAFAPAG